MESRLIEVSGAFLVAGVARRTDRVAHGPGHCSIRGVVCHGRDSGALRCCSGGAYNDSEARRGEQLLRRAEEAASRADYKVTGELLQAREAGPAIVDEARDRGVDAIVLGIGYKRLVGDFQVGRTADYVLKHAPCQVWVVRQAVAQPE